MKFTKIPLNIKRFYFTNDPMKGTNRIKVKNYHDSNGNIVYKKQLFTFNDIYVTEGAFGFGGGSSSSEKKLQVRYNEYDENGYLLDNLGSEEYENYTKLDDDYNIVNNEVYEGPVYLDENEKFICSTGKKVGTLDKIYYYIKQDNNTQKQYTIYQTRNNVTTKFERTLPKYMVWKSLSYIDNRGGVFLTGDCIDTVDAIIRTWEKDKIVLDYLHDDKKVFSETIYAENIDGSYTEIENKDKLYMGHNVSYVLGHNDKGIERELWFEDLGEVKIPDTPTPKPETKGGK